MILRRLSIRISRSCFTAGVGLRCEPASQLGERLAQRREPALDDAGLQIEDLLVEPRHAEPPGALGSEAGDHLEQHRGVLVAAAHPFCGSRGRRGGGADREQGQKSQPGEAPAAQDTSTLFAPARWRSSYLSTLPDALIGSALTISIAARHLVVGHLRRGTRR